MIKKKCLPKNHFMSRTDNLKSSTGTVKQINYFVISKFLFQFVSHDIFNSIAVSGFSETILSFK